jgi:four helix bundle protein
MLYEEWEKNLPSEVTSDSLWKMKAYRLALFLGEFAWKDVSTLRCDRRTVSISHQLYKSLGSIGANLAEGYSRGTGRERARFYEFALGSARESRDWYMRTRYVLGEEKTKHRLGLLWQIIRLLLVMIPDQRQRVLNDPQ